MPPTKFRKRPVVVEAVRWTGDNEAEIQEWVSWPGANGPGSRFFNALGPEDRANCDDQDATAQVFDKLHSTWVLVFTGQWVLRGVQGEFYPITDDVLAVTYEPADVPAVDPVEQFRAALIRHFRESEPQMLGLHPYSGDFIPAWCDVIADFQPEDPS